MEECLVCFEEKKECDFTFFPCTHKVCNKCVPVITTFSANCPVCENPVTIQIHEEKEVEETVSNKCVEMCKIVTVITIALGGIFYIINFSYKI